MPLSLSEILVQYPFERYSEVSSPEDLHGVFVAICCQEGAEGVDCGLLDFGGSVDLRHAIETSLAKNSWHETCPCPVDIMVAVVSPMTCETLLKELQQMRKMDLTAAGVCRR